ncbi:hypothetical protein JL720_12186 [Aureococcus anophagefferens]|nr:hypothetical protein JL720_12186 [Aureococcus anophagefferens]
MRKRDLTSKSRHIRVHLGFCYDSTATASILYVGTEVNPANGLTAAEAPDRFARTMDAVTGRLGEPEGKPAQLRSRKNSCLAFADDAELDAAVRGFVARFALPLDQMGCADDDCAVEYIKAHARLNAACDAAPYGDAAASGVDAASPDDAAPLDDDDTARSEPDATADAGEREAAGEAAPAGAAALLPSTLEDYVTLWMVAWSACFAVAAVVAALDRALDLRVEGASYALGAQAALGAARLPASRAPASPLRETLLWALLHSSERACFESHSLGKQWAYAALVQLWVALTPDDPGPGAGAVGVLFQIWATHAFAGAEKAGLGRDAPTCSPRFVTSRARRPCRVDLCKPDDTVGDVEAFVAASVSVAKITTLDCATDEVRNEDVDLPRPVHM